MLLSWQFTFASSLQFKQFRVFRITASIQFKLGYKCYVFPMVDSIKNYLAGTLYWGITGDILPLSYKFHMITMSWKPYGFQANGGTAFRQIQFLILLFRHVSSSVFKSINRDLLSNLLPGQAFRCFNTELNNDSIVQFIYFGLPVLTSRFLHQSHQ